MATQIIILNVANLGNASQLQVSGVFWLVVPAALVLAAPGATTAVPPSTAVDSTNGVPWGYTAAELNALHAGTTVEQSFSSSYGAADSNATIKSDIFAKFNASQAALAIVAGAVKFIGARFDGAAWSVP
jgi:hypothetical protein